MTQLLKNALIGTVLILVTAALRRLLWGRLPAETWLAHEAVHARRRDDLWHYVMAIALVVCWWDPAVWLMARLLRRDVELSCDRAVLARLGADHRAEYANALISISTQGEGPAFSRPFGQKQAEERIIAIMKYKKTSIVSLTLALVLVCGVTGAFAASPPEKEPEPDAYTVVMDSAGGAGRIV